MPVSSLPGRSRSRAALLLALCSLFLWSGSYHGHDLASPASSQLGFRGSSTGDLGVADDCPVCKLARTSIHVTTPVGSVDPDESTASRASVEGAIPPAVFAPLAFSPRAPPIA